MMKATKAPMGARVSDIFEVKVVGGGMEERPSVYTALVSDGFGSYPLTEEQSAIYTAVNRGTMAEKAYFCGFTSEDAVTVSVVYCGKENIAEVFGVDAIPDGKQVEFTLRPGDKAVVRIDNTTFAHHLAVCCDAPSVCPISDNLIEFPAGDYTVDNCPLIHKNEHGFDVIDEIPSGSIVFLHPGAVVHAALILEGKDHILVTGEGILDTTHFSYGDEAGCFDEDAVLAPLKEHTPPVIYAKTNSHHITIENVTLNGYFRGIVFRNCEDVIVRNVKIFTVCINADGINMMNLRRGRIQDCLICSHDDNIAVFTSCDSIAYLGDPECKNPLPISSDIEVSDCLLFTCCRNFCIGGHSTGSLNPRNLVSNIFVHDINAYIYQVHKKVNIPYDEKWSCSLRILSQTEQDLENIRFENMAFHQRPEYIGKFLHAEVRGSKNASYTEKGGHSIRNLTIKNVTFSHAPGEALPAWIVSNADVDESDYGIFDVTLENIRLGSEKMTAEEPFLKCSGNVKNLKIL